MKSIFLLNLFAYSVLFLSSCSAEKKVVQKGFHHDRYNLVIPGEWQKKAATINAVTSVLERTLVPLQDRNFCFNCNALYTVSLEIDHFEKIAETAVENVFVYDASLVLSDTSGKRISSLRIVNRAEDELV